MSIVVPAVLTPSLEDLKEKIGRFARIPSISRVQIDVVDGRFATPASWPYTAPQEMRDMIAHGEMLPNLDRIEYEMDLMCDDAEQMAGAWLSLGASRLTFHAESVTDISRLLSSVCRRYGDGVLTFGLALNIASDLSLIEPYLPQINYVQFMGIATIGRQGQPFDRRVLEKVRSFRSRHPEIPVQIDGGVSLETAKDLLALGVSNLIAGSAILRAADPIAEVGKFEALATPFGV
jgi:ribulose-phosphate 3-epimerase